MIKKARMKNEIRGLDDGQNIIPGPVETTKEDEPHGNNGNLQPKYEKIPPVQRILSLHHIRYLYG